MKLTRRERARINNAVLSPDGNQFTPFSFARRFQEIARSRQLTFDDLTAVEQMSERAHSTLQRHTRKGWTQALLFADNNLKSMVRETAKLAGDSKHITTEILARVHEICCPVYPFC